MSLEEFTQRNLNCAVLTVSDTRTVDTDKGGKKIISFLELEQHKILDYQIVQDDFEAIVKQLSTWSLLTDLDVIITTGGTGIAKRDVTIEAVHSLLEKEINGFGELFRFLSFTEDIGTKAMASRALAGVYGDKLIFSIPGSVGAITLGMERLILPEMKHLVREITK